MSTTKEIIEQIHQHVKDTYDVVNAHVEAAKKYFELQQVFITTAADDAWAGKVTPTKHVVIIDGRGTPEVVQKQIAAVAAQFPLATVSVDVNALKIYVTT